MTNQEKLTNAEKWLKENGYRCKSNHYSKTCDVMINLKVAGRVRVAVFLSEGENEDREKFRNVRNIYRPVFVRDEDSAEFVVEKIVNTIARWTKAQKKPRRKRMRIPKVEKVSYNY